MTPQLVGGTSLNVLLDLRTEIKWHLKNHSYNSGYKMADVEIKNKDSKT